MLRIDLGRKRKKICKYLKRLREINDCEVFNVIKL